jgi:hypothetical protein
MKIKKLVVSLLVAGFLVVPMAAQACSVTGQVIRLFEYSGVGYIYVKPSPTSLTGVYYVFASTSAELRDAARTGMNSGKNVTVFDGVNDSCVSGGTNNGSVYYIIVNP